MATQELIPFWSIVEQIRQYSDQRRTGTAFIVSDDNRMAQVHLESGNIVALLCRGRRGLEALAGMRTMLNGRLRFDDTYVAPADKESFCTADVIDLLASELPKSGQAAPAPVLRVVVPPPPPVAAPPAPTPAPARAISPDAVALLEKMLVVYIGPMAQIVCGDHAEQAGNLQGLIVALSDEIPDKKQAAQFEADALRNLGLG